MTTTDHQTCQQIHVSQCFAPILFVQVLTCAQCQSACPPLNLSTLLIAPSPHASSEPSSRANSTRSARILRSLTTSRGLAPTASGRTFQMMPTVRAHDQDIDTDPHLVVQSIPLTPSDLGFTSRQPQNFSIQFHSCINSDLLPHIRKTQSSLSSRYHYSLGVYSPHLSVR